VQEELGGARKDKFMLQAKVVELRNSMKTVLLQNQQLKQDLKQSRLRKVSSRVSITQAQGGLKHFLVGLIIHKQYMLWCSLLRFARDGGAGSVAGGICSPPFSEFL